MFVLKVLIPLLCIAPEIYAQSQDSDKHNCAALFRSPGDPRWIDLEQTVGLFDFLQPPTSINDSITDESLKLINSENLNQSVQARLRILKLILHKADQPQPAELFLSHFYELSRLPGLLYTKAELVDQSELMTFIALAKFDIGHLHRQAVFLTILTLANHHLDLILKDRRVMAIIRRSICEKFSERPLSPALPMQHDFRRHQFNIQEMINHQKTWLLTGPKKDVFESSLGSVPAGPQKLDTGCQAPD